MSQDLSRRETLRYGLSAAALATSGGASWADIKAADVAPPALKIESGAALKLLRPVRFVKPDEDLFRANAQRFTEKTGVDVKVDFVGWEDINQQTAVTSNSGAGPGAVGHSTASNRSQTAANSSSMRRRSRCAAT